MAKIRNISRLTELYNINQLTDERELSPSSYTISKQSKDKLDELFPRLTVSQISIEMSKTIYDQLCRYPCHRQTKFKRLTLEQCYHQPDYVAIKLKTVKAVFYYLKRVLTWAMNTNLINKSNVVTFMVLPKIEKEVVAKSRGQLILPTSKNERMRRKSNKAVLPWTNSLLENVFDAHIYNNEGKKRFRRYIPLHYWLFPIAYYHGMRAREISQLTLDDVIEIDGYYGLAVNDSKPFQRVKNTSSRRFVPIHDDILKLGFLSFLEWRKSHRTDSEMLFMTPLTASFLGQSGAHNTISQRLRREVGITPRSGFNTHSFRHFFIDDLRAKNVPKWKIASLVGHDFSDQKSITDQYGAHSLSIDELNQVVNTFDPPVKIKCNWAAFKNRFIESDRV